MKILIQFLLGLLGAILLGIVGLLSGAFGVGLFIYDIFGSPEFGGNVGYEASGVFFAIVGISVGSILGIMIAKKLQKETQTHLIISIITAVIMIITGVILFDYYMPLTTSLTILLMPPVVLTLVTNWQKFLYFINNKFHE